MKTKVLLLGIGASALLSINSVMAVNILSGFDASTLAGNDDSSTGPLPIGFSIDFYGTSYSSLYANNNGNVTFDGPMSTFTPFNLDSAAVKIIAPFFADVDTRAAGSAKMQYGTGTYNGNSAFGVTWNGVGYYPSAADKLNEFQVILENRSDTGAGNFDIHFFYDQIQWETGGASGGSGGLGGSSARAGYSNGTALNSFEIAGSAVNGAFLDGGPNSLVAGSNIGDPGHFRFSVRNGTVVVPDGGSMAALLGLALTGLGVARRRMQ